MSGLAGLRVLVADGDAERSAHGRAIALALAAGGAEVVEAPGGSPLDALVLVTPAARPVTLAQTSDADWDAALEQGLIAPCRIAAELLPALAARPGASIAVVAAAPGVWPVVADAYESIVKRGLVMLTQMLAIEGLAAGVRANAVCPSRAIASDDVAEAVLSLLVGVANGAVLVLDGGRSAAVRAAALLDSEAAA